MKKTTGMSMYSLKIKIKYRYIYKTQNLSHINPFLGSQGVGACSTPHNSPRRDSNLH